VVLLPVVLIEFTAKRCTCVRFCVCFYVCR